MILNYNLTFHVILCHNYIIVMSFLYNYYVNITNEKLCNLEAMNMSPNDFPL